MSRATREQIYSALFAKLQGISGLTTVSRRLANIQDVQPENFPAAYQIQEKQSAKYQGSVPTRTVLRASWLFYSYDTDPNGAPSIGLNNLVAVWEAVVRDFVVRRPAADFSPAEKHTRRPRGIRGCRRRHRDFRGRSR